MLAHTYPINYNLYDVNNNSLKPLTVKTGTGACVDSFVFTEDSWIVDESIEYFLEISRDRPVSYYHTESALVSHTPDVL